MPLRLPVAGGPGSQHPRGTKMNRFAAITVIALLVSPAVEAAQMYRWVDENGVTHFSTKRPPQKNAEQLELRGKEVILEVA